MKADELLKYWMDDPVIGDDYEMYRVKDVESAIAELKDKIQQKDFFWEGCGFAKRGFKNTIEVGLAYEEMERQRDDFLHKNRTLAHKLHDAEMRADIAEAANTEYREDFKKMNEGRTFQTGKWVPERTGA